MSTIIAPPGDTSEAKLIRVLNRHARVRGRDLMTMLGLRFNDDGSRFDAHVKFLNIVIRARMQLERGGHTIKTSGGGSMADFYWIEPQGSSS